MIIVISWRKDDTLRGEKAINSGAKYFATLISALFISLFRVILSLFRGEKTKAKRRNLKDAKLLPFAFATK